MITFLGYFLWISIVFASWAARAADWIPGPGDGCPCPWPIVQTGCFFTAIP